MIVHIILLSIVSFAIAVLVTPRVAALAERFDLLDKPSARKVHNIAIPRIGGLAIFISFSLTLFLSLFFESVKSQLGINNNELVYLLAGGLLSFLLGFYDDVKQLGPKVKFAVQIAIALFAYFGGIKIQVIGLPLLGTIQFGWLNLPVTVFWMLLVINAINLIDGLDGLAAGVSFFVCLVLLVVTVGHGLFLVAIILACLVGSLLGFLVFNFNPASIFMGDSGSYFLGYMLASLSIIGSVKSHTAFTFLIPIIAMGVPLFDTVWATVRRFMCGQELFQPDKNHFHHRLLLMGYSHKRTVAILYGLTIGLGGLALLTINVRDQVSASLLGILGILFVVFVRKLGYLDFIGIKSFLRWLNDLANVTGLNRDRRIFLAYQLAVAESETLDIFWERVVASAKHLGLDYIEMQLGGEDANFKKFNDYIWQSLNNEERTLTDELYSRHRLYIRFPLECENSHYGLLKVSKKHTDSDKEHSQTLWRLEFLRRTLSCTLHKFKQNTKYGLQDRRVPLGDRRLHTIKDKLLDDMEEEQRRTRDRRQPPSTTQRLKLQTQ